MRSLATREAGSEISQGAARRDRGVQGRRASTSCIVETSGIGQGDAAIVPLVDTSLYVMTPEFGAAIAAREDRHARLRRLRRDQQVRPQGRAGRAARRAQAVPAQPRGVEGSGRGRCRCSARWPRASTTTASPRSTRRWCAKLRDEGTEARAGHAAGRRRPGTRPAQNAHRARGARALPRRDRRDRARLPRVGRRAGAPRARAAAAARDAGRCWPRSARRTSPRSTRWPPTATRSSMRARGSSSTCGRRRRRPTPATSTS